LRFVRSEHGDVELTSTGKAFAEADMADRRRLFREAALANIALFQQIETALATKSDRSMPLEFFRDILQRHFSKEEAKHQLDTALDWGRYSGIFSYDSEADRLVLRQPAHISEEDQVSA
jgi:NitT/TauT family transport system ATP-binding protein